MMVPDGLAGSVVVSMETAEANGVPSFSSTVMASVSAISNGLRVVESSVAAQPEKMRMLRLSSKSGII